MSRHHLMSDCGSGLRLSKWDFTSIPLFEQRPPFLRGCTIFKWNPLFLASAPAARKKFRLLKPTPISARSVALLRSCFSSSAVRTGVFQLTAPSLTLSVTWSCYVDYGTLYFLLAFSKDKKPFLTSFTAAAMLSGDHLLLLEGYICNVLFYSAK